MANQRDDEYGGSLENRMRFPLEVFDIVRAAFPADKPVGVRVSATDWVEGGWTIEQTDRFAQELKKRGCDWIDVSTGGLSPLQRSRLDRLSGAVCEGRQASDRASRLLASASSPSRCMRTS